MDDAAFDDAVRKAFAATRNLNMRQVCKVHAFTFVPLMSRSTFRDRFDIFEFLRAMIGRPTWLSPVAEETVDMLSKLQNDIGKPAGRRTIQNKLTPLAAHLAKPTNEYLRTTVWRAS